MENETIRAAIAENIVALRRKSGMTQQELADALRYTDKAVSKWERAESIPDVVILKRVADLFGVTVDYLLASHADDPATVPLPPSHRRHMRGFIMGISILLVWLAATVAFVITMLLSISFPVWLIYIYAVPASAVVWLVFNAVWFNQKINYVAISLLMWTTLTAIHLTALTVFANQIWMIYLLGIPGQVIILLWSGMGRRPMRRKKSREPKNTEKKENPSD